MISCLISNEQALEVNLIPKEDLAMPLIFKAVSLPNLPLLFLDKMLDSLVVFILRISSGVGQLSNNCLEVEPKVSQKS